MNPKNILLLALLHLVFDTCAIAVPTDTKERTRNALKKLPEIRVIDPANLTKLRNNVK